MTDSAAGTVWADWEIDLIVADYFRMLKQHLSGEPYVKADHNQALQQIIPRSRKSIEFKHCNISAVLIRLGIKPIPGYAPLANFQNALIDGVERYLAHQGEPIFSAASEVSAKVAEAASLWIGPPPSTPAGWEKETEALRRLVRKFDPAERDARNRALGKQGEELVLERERAHLLANGRKDLERKLEWTSEVRGDGAGYDIIAGAGAWGGGRSGAAAARARRGGRSRRRWRCWRRSWSRSGWRFRRRCRRWEPKKPLHRTLCGPAPPEIRGRI